MRSRSFRMLNLVTAAVALAAALVAGPALAEEAAAGRAKGKAALATVRGVVKAASATALAVETGPGGKDIRFVLDERTVVMGMKPLARIAATELRTGDPVTVSYADEGGRAVARRVWRRSPASGAGAGAEKGKPTASR